MLCAGLLVAGCSQNDVTSTEPQAFTVSATPVLPRIPSGESADIVVSATRGSGTSGPVVFSFVGEPQGVTVTWSPQQVSGSVIKSIATVLVDTSVAAGSYEFRVYARTDAAIADAGVGLVVLGGPPDFTLAANPDTVSIIPGGLWTVQVDVAAVDFQGEKVHLELLNPPPGVSARFTPDSVSGGHSTLILSVAPSAPAGSYGLTVQGSGTGLPVRSVPLALTVSDAPSGLSVNLDVSQCSEANRPTWLAVQDGVGNPWIALAAASGVYQASFSQPNVGIAYTVGGSQPGLVVSYLTREEAVAAQPYRFCHKPASRSVTGAAVGLAGGESAYIAMGDGVTVAAANGAFLLNPVLGGLRDLVAYKSSTTGPGPSDRMLLLRDQDPAVGVGSLDFGGPNAATPASAAMQVLGANAGATTSQTMAFLTGASCDFSLLYSASSVPDTGFTASGAPAALLRPSDFHQLVVSTIDAGGTSFRTVAESFNQMAPRVLTFGDPLPALSVVTLSGAYLRLQATASPPTEYQSNAFLSYSAAVGGTTHLASIVASSGWLGGSSATLIMPDLSDIPAFDAKAPPPPSSSGRWTFTAAGMSGGSACTEGSRTVTATRTGIF